MTAADAECLCEPQVGLLVRAPTNWPGVNGWLYVETEAGEKEIRLLRLTVVNSHEVTGNGFVGAVQHARRGSWSDAKYRLVFVVPSREADIYRTTQQKEVGVRWTQLDQGSVVVHPPLHGEGCGSSWIVAADD